MKKMMVMNNKKKKVKKIKKIKIGKKKKIDWEKLKTRKGEDIEEKEDR